MSSRIAELESRFQLDSYKRYPITLTRGAGVFVYDEDDHAYLDMYGGHAVTAIGHKHPRLNSALKSQLDELLFYSNLVHCKARALAAAALIEIAPPPMSRSFFVNSGAEAIENALKLARKFTQKQVVLSFEGGFHGRTLGALAATGIAKYRTDMPPIGGYEHLPFGDAKAAASRLARGDVAAVLIEPVQSLAGVRVAAAGFLEELRLACSRHEALLIYDEIQTGFGRTGTWFFAPRHGVVPDIMVLGKAIGSGIPAAAVLTGEAIAACVKPGDLGTTFGGAPLAMAALATTISIMADEKLPQNAAQMGEKLRAALRGIDGVEAVSGLGLLLGIKLRGGAKPWVEKLLARRIITGTSDDPAVLRLMPPLTLNARNVAQFAEAMKEASQELTAACAAEAPR